MAFRTLDDADFSGKTVLVRVDLNVPVSDGKITDTTRIDRIASGVNEIVSRGGKVALLAHFGRPKGEVNPDMSLAVVAPALSDILGRTVAFAPDCVGADAERVIGEAGRDTVILLENTRFHAGEEKNDPDFAKALAAMGDIYVNDAFSAAHRAHASTEGIAKLLPAFAGRTMQAELEALDAALGSPTRPVIAIVGGAKVSTKLELLGNLIEKTDHLVIGGGMANTFLAAQGVNVQKSLCEHDLLDTARQISAKAKDTGCEIILPDDVVVAWEFAANVKNETCPVSAVPESSMILDAGPKAVDRISSAISKASTLVWNGPLGAFELTPFDAATVSVARHAAALTAEGRLVSVAGGGDTVSALNHAGASEKFTYISTAGGAFLEWMEGKTLPGVAALG